MILRKPYAFLIKHFQKIHFVLLLLTIFILYKNLNFSSMVGEYLTTKYYNPNLTPMSEYASFFTYFVLFLIVVISAILIYLLYHKKKPVIVYGLFIAEYVAVMISFAYAASYFERTGFGLINLQQALLVRDILFIVSIPQYAVLVLLVIRTLGLDLKRFGFREDEEYIDIQEEDREEFEVEVGIDPNNIKRTIRQKWRFFRYFLEENKLIITILLSVVVLIVLYQGYQIVFVKNRVYHLNEVFDANIYQMKINQIYFTGRDYKGAKVNNEKRKYLIVDLNIKNKAQVETDIDTNKFVIAARNKFYAPIRTHDKYFTDLGQGYQGEKIKPGVDNRFLLIYEIMPEDLGSAYTLYYQEVLSRNEAKLRKIESPITDLSDVGEVEKKQLEEEMTVKFYNGKEEKFQIKSFEMKEEITYLSTSCYVWDCRVYENTLKSSSFTGKPLILKLTYDGDKDGLDFSSFLSMYATIHYDDATSELRLPLSRKWKGNYAYLLIPREVLESETISFEFVTRDKNYRYYLKGGNVNG